MVNCRTKSAPEYHRRRTILDRRGLNEVTFGVLGMTAGEREAVVSLVRARLEKAKSV